MPRVPRTPPVSFVGLAARERAAAAADIREYPSDAQSETIRSANEAVPRFIQQHREMEQERTAATIFRDALAAQDRLRQQQQPAWLSGQDGRQSQMLYTIPDVAPPPYISDTADIFNSVAAPETESKPTKLKFAGLKLSVETTYSEPRGRDSLVDFVRDMKRSRDVLARHLTENSNRRSAAIHEVLESSERRGIKERRRIMRIARSAVKTYTGVFKHPVFGELQASGETVGEVKAELQAIIASRRSERRHIRSRNGSAGARSGCVYSEPGLFVKKFQSMRRRRMYVGKKPTVSVPHVGVEIECVVMTTEEQLCDLFLKQGLEKYVELHQDGSIRPVAADECQRDCCQCAEHCDFGECRCSCIKESRLRIEVVVCAAETEINRVLKGVCAVLQTAGVSINKSCGLHVHLDQRNRNYKDTYKRLVNALPLLSSMVPANRTTNRFCRPNEYVDFDEQLSKTGGDSGARYYAVNPMSMMKHRTIEVRLHSGTANYRKITNWIALLIFIADHETSARTVRSLGGLQRMVGHLPKKLESWVAERVAKFSTDDNVLSIDDKINRKVVKEVDVDREAA